MEKTYIITGGNSGLGYECAKNIAMENKDNHIIIASRNLDKSILVAQTISCETNNPNIYARHLDLASVASIREFCKIIVQTPLPPLHGLVCNAISGSNGKNEYTADGFEMTFGTGHLGHFLLANILLPNITDGGRIVFVSSDRHASARYNTVHELAFPKEYNHMNSYTGTKLCNIYCVYEMDRRIRHGISKDITVNAFNPAFMADTGLGKATSLTQKAAKFIAPFIAGIMGLRSTAAKSGKILASLMTDGKYEGISGKYFDRGKETRSSEISYNEDNAKSIWHDSAELVNLKEEDTILPIR